MPESSGLGFPVTISSEARTLMYTVSQKKQDTKLLPITSPNVN